MSSPVDATLIPPDETRPKASTVEPTLFPPDSPASPGPPALPQTLVPPEAKLEPVAPTLCPPEEVPAHPTVPAPASLPGSTSRPSGTRPVVPAIASSALAHATPTVKVTPSQVSTNPGTMSGVVRKLNNQGTIAGYEILGELGRGGMGVVYRARQVRLNRLVALKMILAGGHASSRAVARFKAEAESIARLQHPNVVQVYEIGEHDGHPFFSLEFVDGGALDGKLAGTPQPPRQAAILVEKLARAMHEAHSRGVIHRDLKPQNVLLTRDGEPKITDFGLAKTLDSDSGSTREGEVMGTPSYMAPEQAAGKIKDMGPATDVYALGAILYETLTGRPPFKAATPYDTLLQVLHEEPVPVRQLQARTPRDLETICHKCLQKDIPRRYGSALELAEDLRRFLEGEPIQARSSSAWERGLKWARRHPTAASLLGVACLAAVGLFAGILWYHQHLQQVVAAARADEQSARMAEQQAREAQQLAQTRLEGQSRIQAGKAALDARDWQAAQLSLTQALAVLGQQAGVRDLRDQASRLLAVVKARLAEQDAAARAAERRQEFTRLRDNALFYASAFTGLDLEANRQATIQAASRALALYGFGPQARTSPTGEDRPDAEILEGCQELTLVLAEAVAQAPAGLSSSEKTARVREALRLMEPVRKMGTLSHAFHRRRARYLLLLGEHEESGRETAAALQRKPTSPLDHFLNGDDSLRQGRLTQADQDFEAALRLRPDHFWARYFLAVCQLRQQRHGEAAANLTGCLACRDLVWIFLLRGFADGERGRFDAAEADYQRALERKPDDLARYALFVNRGVRPSVMSPCSFGPIMSPRNAGVARPCWVCVATPRRSRPWIATFAAANRAGRSIAPVDWRGPSWAGMPRPSRI